MFYPLTPSRKKKEEQRLSLIMVEKNRSKNRYVKKSCNVLQTAAVYYLTKIKRRLKHLHLTLLRFGHGTLCDRLVRSDHRVVLVYVLISEVVLKNVYLVLKKVICIRYLRGAGFEKLQKALAAQDGSRSPIAPPSPSVTSLAKYSFSVVSLTRPIISFHFVCLSYLYFSLLSHLDRILYLLCYGCYVIYYGCTLTSFDD